MFISLGTYLAFAMRTVRKYRHVLASTHSDVRKIPLAWLSFAVAGLSVVYVLAPGVLLLQAKPHGRLSAVL